MTHTAGFEEVAKYIMFSDPTRLMPLDAYLKYWTPKRIFAPGTTPAYSNYGATLAGYIVECIAKQPFDDYIEQHIFAPLGMANSTFRQPLPRRLAGMMSRGYSVASAKPTPFEIVGPAPGGSLSSTGADMARFMIAHLQDGALGRERILRPETARMMHNTPLTLLPPLNRMELGFYETNINGRSVIGHGGDTDAFHSYLYLFLDENVGLFVSFNSNGTRSLRTELYERFADRYFPSSQRDGRVPAKVAAGHARMMVGVYESSRRSETSFLSLYGFLEQVKVGLDARGGITIPALRGVDGQMIKWVEIAPFVWREAHGHLRLAAKVVDGTVVRFSFDDVSPFIVYDRVSPARSSAWLLPLLYASLAALALTALFWPVTALVRRRLGTTLALDHRSLIAYRGTKIAATLILAVLIGWAGVGFALTTDYNNLSDTIDGPLLLLQITGLVAFVGGFAAMLWNLWTVWRGKRRWPAKLWSVVLVCAAATVLWIAAAFKLLAFTVNF